MFWSKIAGVYDLVENVYNGKANARTTDYVASLMAGDDKAVAANVIHLVDDPKKAIDELKRVVKPGGMIIIPTYIHFDRSIAADVFNKAGAGFKRHFTEENYKKFFEDLGIDDVKFNVLDGRMQCDVAVFTNG